MSEQNLTLECVSIKNLMGLGVNGQTLELKFDNSINIIQGSNESGKTRLINLINLLFSERIYTDWVRTNDKEPGEMIATFSDGSKAVIEATDKKITRRAYDSQGLANDTLLKSLKSAIMERVLDAGKFLENDGWDYRLKTAVSAIKEKITLEKFQDKIGDTVPGINYETDALTVFEEAEKYFKEKRRDIGQWKSKSEKTVDTLKEALENIELDEGIELKVSENENVLRGLYEEKNRRLDIIEKESNEKKLEFQKVKDVIEQDAREKISELEKQIQQIKDQANIDTQNINKEISDFELDIEKRKTEVNQDIQKEIAEIEAKKNSLSELKDLQIAAKTQMDMLKQNETEFKQYSDK